MIVKTADYLEKAGGVVDSRHWLRPIPGRPGWSSLCLRPQYSKKKKKIMAERPMVKLLASVNKEASAILRDPVQKAEWEKRHIQAQQEASKHQRRPSADGKPAVPARLWDYIRHKLSEQRKQMC